MHEKLNKKKEDAFGEDCIVFKNKNKSLNSSFEKSNHMLEELSKALSNDKNEKVCINLEEKDIQIPTKIDSN